jgi:hypothetical protein
MKELMPNSLYTTLYIFFFGAILSSFGMSLACVHPERGAFDSHSEITLGSIKSAHHSESHFHLTADQDHSIQVENDFCVDMLFARCKVRLDRTPQIVPPSFFYHVPLVLNNFKLPSIQLNEINWHNLSIVLLRTIVMLN